MKLYVINPHTSQKIYLNRSASTRAEFARQIGYKSFYIDDIHYHVNNVFAEIETNDTATGAVVGGVVGTIGGPFGILIGGLVGGMLGNTNDTQKMNAVRTFNISRT